MTDVTGDLVLYTVKELYPIALDRRAIAITQSVLTWGCDTDGNYLLSRALTGDERSFLLQRRKELSEALIGASDKEIRKSVSRMLSGFMAGKDVSDDTAKAAITQYIITLRRLPWWAVERACQKFSRGEITVINDQSVNLAYGPSTAQLYQVAQSISGDFYSELDAVNRALTGVLEYKPSPEEVERIGNGLRELAESMRAGMEAERPPKWYDKPITDEYIKNMQDDLRRIYGKPAEESSVATE